MKLLIVISIFFGSIICTIFLPYWLGKLSAFILKLFKISGDIFDDNIMKWVLGMMEIMTLLFFINITHIIYSNIIKF